MGCGIDSKSLVLVFLLQESCKKDVKKEKTGGLGLCSSFSHSIILSTSLFEAIRRHSQRHISKNSACVKVFHEVEFSIE